MRFKIKSHAVSGWASISLGGSMVNALGRIKKISTKTSTKSVGESIRAMPSLMDSSGDPSATLTISPRLLLEIPEDDAS